MHSNADNNDSFRQMDSVSTNAPVPAGTEAAVDSQTLERLDIGLFRALHKLGTSKQRICSALWLSYAEYDQLIKQM